MGWTKQRVMADEANRKNLDQAIQLVLEGKPYFYDDLKAVTKTGHYDLILQWDLIKELVEERTGEELVKVTEAARELDDTIASADQHELDTKLERVLSGMVAGRGPGGRAAGCISAKGNGLYIHELAKDKAECDSNGTTKRVERLSSNLEAHLALPGPAPELEN